MKTKIVPILISVLVLFETVVYSEVNSADKSGTNHSFTAQTGISLGTWAVAVTTMFLIDKIRTDHQRGDSIISFFDSAYTRDIELYNAGSFIPSNAGFTALLSEYSTYSRYIKKRRHSLTIHYDTLNRYVEKSVLLKNLLNVIENMRRRSDSLPDNDYDILNSDRRVLNDNISSIQTIIDRFVSQNILNADVVRFGFRHSIKKLALVDSLIREVYREQKDMFNVKCRYFYNRAIESGDTSRIRDFVDDCDYYQIDKEWCTRARLVIEPPPVVKPVATAVQPVESVAAIKKMTQVDSVNQDYQIVINSGRIDLLEGYIVKYSKKKYTRYKAKLDSVKTVLTVLTKKLEAEKQYNQSHPLLANGDFNHIETFYRGISRNAETVFKSKFQSLEQEFRNIPGFRFPVSVSVDYAVSPPILMLQANVRCPEDIGVKKDDSLTIYSVQGVSPAVKFLNELKLKVAEEIKGSSSNDEELIKRAVYIVRLVKSAGEYVTFYGKDKTASAVDSTDFYSFYDITLKNYHDIRFETNSVPEILVNRSDNDSLKRILSLQFFER